VQSEQVIALVAEEYFPMAHSEHVVAPATEAYFPTTQSEQAVAPAVEEYFPAAQVDPAHPDSPIPVIMVPAGLVHAEHAVVPCIEEN